MDINDLKRRRAAIVAEARKINDLALSESRDFTAEERQEYDRAMADVDRLGSQIEDREKLEKVAGELANIPGPVIAPQSTPEDRQKAEGEKRMAAFRASLLHPADRGEAEHRALAQFPDSSGGYTIAPQQFLNQLIQGLDNDVFMQRLATVQRIEGAASLGVPSLDADPADPTWTTELLVGSEDSTMSFGKRELAPHPAAQYIKVSRTLLRRSPLNVESLVEARLRYKMGVVRENAFLNGNGAGQPLGIFTASNDGVDTGRDFDTGNTSTSITTDGLIEAQHGLAAGYRGRAIWVFHDDAVKQIRKLKDGEGRYIWQPGIVSGAPDVIFNRPVYTSAYAPNTFTTNLYVGAFFVPEFYWIAEDVQFTIQRLDELYAATNQVGYIVRSEVDGMPVLAAAFARVKLD